MNFSKNLKRLMLVSSLVICALAYNVQQPKVVYPEEVQVKTVQSAQSQLTFRRLDVPMDSVLQEWTYDLCWRHKIDFTLIMAMIKQESNFRPDAISSTNDYGLMQINIINHHWLREKFGITDFCDPYANIVAGVFMVKELFKKYPEPGKMLMAYHMGEEGAAKFWKRGIFESHYSKSVLAQKKAYEKEIRGEHQ